MAKKVVYRISGFDCPNCASKTEKHLNQCGLFKECTIDFVNERMYATYEKNEASTDKILETIKEVEGDPIKLEVLEKGKRENNMTIFDGKFFFMLGRILAATIIMVTTIIVFGMEFSWWAFALYFVAAVIVLYDIFWNVIKNIIHLRNPIDMNLLLTVSCLGVFVLCLLMHFGVFEHEENVVHIDMMDGTMVIILYQVGELLEHIATGKSKKAIADAIDLRADSANLIKNGEVVKVKPEDLKIGDSILVQVGEIIPVDGEIYDGNGTLDTSSLTGESMPIEATKRTKVLSGMVLKSGSIKVEVEKLFVDSTMSKILELVQNSGERKGKIEKFITKFARWYTPIVFFVGILFAVIFGLITGMWSSGIYRGLSIIVVACPCAIVISVPLAYFAGIGLASKKGIIIKGSSFLDAMCEVGTLFIDKTGTLTYGNFDVVESKNLGVSEEEFEEALMLAECRSNHPIAKAILKGKNTANLQYSVENYEEFAGLGTKVKHSKNIILAGNKKLLDNEGIKVPEVQSNGTVIYVAKNGECIGYVILKDIVREDSKEFVEKMNKLGINVVLLTGDKKAIAEDVANEVGIKEYHAELLPQDKTKFVEEKIEKKTDNKLIAFAGDGINDTPSIIRADVGYAMGGIGSDAAVENADVVIMEDKPEKIYESIRIAKKVKNIAIFNTVFSIFIKFSVIVLFMVGVVKQMFIAILADTGLMMLMTLNSLLIIYRKVK